MSGRDPLQPVPPTLASLEARISDLERELVSVKNLTLGRQPDTGIIHELPSGGVHPPPSGKDGDYLAIKDADGHDAVRLYGGGRSNVLPHGSTVAVGGYSYDGAVQVFAEWTDEHKQAPIKLDAGNRQIAVSGTGAINSASPQFARMTIGGLGCVGELQMLPASVTNLLSSPASKAPITLTGDGTIVVRTPAGEAVLALGPGGGFEAGNVSMHNGTIKFVQQPGKQRYFIMDANGISLGGDPQFGGLQLASDGRIQFTGTVPGEEQEPTRVIMALGPEGITGRHIVLDATHGIMIRNHLLISDPSGNETIRFDGTTGESFLQNNLRIGYQNHAGSLTVHNQQGAPAIHIDGASGDILLQNADCAEEFEISDAYESFEPGTVVSVSQDGKLEPSGTAYDTHVVGVIAGAEGLRPALVLGRAKGRRARVALLGQTYCKVDTRNGPVKPGDLLVSSDRIGYAMVATDKERITGALLGKAQSALTSGLGTVRMLVALR